MTAGCGFPHSLPAPGAAIVTGHLGGDATFVEKDQLRRVNLARFLPPEAALEAGCGGILLGGVE